jgi:glyoxylase-like metal-dependent hydrolase (beta-lactamase superfamily II)
VIDEIRAFEGGYCRQLLAMIDRRSWRMVRFQAVFLALRHRREGWVLVDTGYGAQFKAATKHLPGRFYRWVTPTTSVGTTTAQLENAGIRATDVRHVIVTHFHADHVGGLVEFPHANVHYHAEALLPLQQLSALRQVRAAFLADLVPSWLPDRASLISASGFRSTPDLPFNSHDLFGDGSIQLVDLPGHAPGHVGVSFSGLKSRELYTADAFWRRSQIVDGIEPLGIAMACQWDRVAYRNTVDRLRRVHQQGRYRLTACHDDDTCAQLDGLAPAT